MGNVARAILLGCLFLSFGSDSWSKPPDPRDIGQSTPERPKAADQHPGTDQKQPGTEEVPFFVKIIPSNHTQAEIEEERKQSDEKAASDRALVNWTAALVGATLFLAFVAAVQAGLFVWQLAVMRDGVHDAKTVADAAKISADAAKGGTDIARISMISNNRAYVHHAGVSWISHPITGTPGGLFWRLWPSWSNSGNTPTRNLVCIVAYHVGDKLPDDFDFTAIDSTPRVPASISARGSITSAPRDISSDELLAVQQGTKFLYVWGTARYNDVYPQTEERITRFCVHAQLVMGDPTKVWNQETNAVEIRFIHYDQNNCSDEECNI